MIRLYIREWAKQKGTNLSRLAEDIGVTQPNISLIATGKTWPRDETIEKIASVLGIEAYLLFFPPNYGNLSTACTCPHCGGRIDIKISAPDM